MEAKAANQQVGSVSDVAKLLTNNGIPNEVAQINSVVFHKPNKSPTGAGRNRRNKMKHKTIDKTCPACPAQFEGQLDDGRYFYGRYRWGCLTISLGDKPDSAVGGKVIYSKRLGDDYHGEMSLMRFKRILTGI